ncbi:cytochrome P450 4V2-like [Tropilaelaps mercedesae]|uniref:Cytochrome P450 4V2-like n=1 Tax=Tropilaelaps mercedesae TaxID=418985 RepID=A0A1V9XKG6_9ACAR|nr:cytochrome P450 4V2-like [Tropilaelaps mercedesae]
MEDTQFTYVAQYLRHFVDATRILRYPFLALFRLLDCADHAMREVFDWIRMWWILLPMEGPFDRIPLIWNLVAHFSIVSAGPQLDYNVGVFNAVDGLFFQLRRHKVFKAYLGLTPFVTVSTAEGVAKVLSDPHNIAKSMLYDMLVPWMGGGLLTGNGPSYRRRRKLITPAFHFRVLENLTPIMEKHGDVFCSKLKGVVDVMQFAQVLGLDIITEAAMGIELHAQCKPDEPYVRAVYRAAQAHMHRVTRPWLWSDLIYYLTPLGRQFKAAVQEMHAFVTKVIDDRLSIIKADPSKATQSFLDMLIMVHLKQPDELTLIDLRDEVHTFMFAGHDTTASATAFALYMMGLHPDVQERIHQELDLVFADATEPVTVAKLKRLRYLDATIKESQRLYPSAPVIARRVDKDMEIDGYTVPRGATLNLFSYGLHRDPKHFPEPLEFRPERFLRADAAALAAPTKIPPFAFFPFSGGMRNCLGQKFAIIEMKTVLAQVMRKFRLKSLQKRDELELAIEVIVRPRNGLQVRFERRKKDTTNYGNDNDNNNNTNDESNNRI